MQMVCSIPDCGRPNARRGYCNKHYLRLIRYGDPLASGPLKNRMVKWLKEKSFYTGDDCVEWPFSKWHNGYGQFRWKGLAGAHRIMCYMVYGPPPTSKHQAAHSCSKKLCVTPRHLSWKLPKDNATYPNRKGSGQEQPLPTNAP